MSSRATTSALRAKKARGSLRPGFTARDGNGILYNGALASDREPSISSNR
jgi:hypothetical protein